MKHDKNTKRYPFIIYKKNFANSKVKKLSNLKGWTKEEDSLLINIVNNIGCKWKFISKYFPRRNIYEIYNRYFKINPSLKKGRFTQEEDDQIIEFIRIHGINWAKLARIMNNRTSKQIRSRYVNKLSNLNSGNISLSTKEDNSFSRDEIEFDLSNDS